MRTSTAAGLVGAAILSTLIFPSSACTAQAAADREEPPEPMAADDAAAAPARGERRSYDWRPPGRVAQWESARFTRERSLVRNQPRPSCTSAGTEVGAG